MMKNKISILLIIFLQSFVSFAQVPNWTWAKNAGSTSTEYSNSICTDLSGNVFITGCFEGNNLPFDTIILTNNGMVNYSDIFLAKYDPNGNVLWAKSAGGYENDVSTSICSDLNGYIYITGYFESTISFDSLSLTHNGPGFTDDSFLAKYDPNGNLVWVKNIGGIGDDDGNSVCTDLNGNIYVTGFFSDTAFVLGTDTLINTNQENIFLAKFDSNGNVLWARSPSKNYFAAGYGVTTDISGNAYITGAFGSDTLIFNNDTLINKGDADIFIVKYDQSGDVVWAKSAGGIGDENALCISADIMENIYVGGWFYSPSINFGIDTLINDNTNGLPQSFIVKYDHNGNVLWALKINTQCNYGPYISSDLSGNIFVIGNFSQSYVVLNSDTLFCNGVSDIFLSKFDSSGNFIWDQSIGGSGSDIGTGIANSLGNVYITGMYNSPTISFGTNILNNIGFVDIYTASFSSTNNLETIKDNNYMFSIYPNPSNNFFTIIVPADTRNVQIINSLGQIVQSKIVDRETKLDFEIKKSGIYFIQVTTDKQTVTKKLIVTN